MPLLPFSNLTFGVSQELEIFPTNVQLIAGPWVLSPWAPSTNGVFLSRFNEAANLSKIPYIYLYIAAGKMRAVAGIEDDNVPGDPNLKRSVAGANFLRNNYSIIENEYSLAAQQIKNIYGTTRPIALHFEPDFYQYNASSQLGGPITPTDMATAMNSWISAVKTQLPQASVVIDISPWNSNLTTWHAPIQNVDYGGLVGKAFPPDGDGSVSPAGIDGKTYYQISQQAGKPLILDDAHGPGGAYLPFDYNWGDLSKRTARYSDAVRAVLLPPNDNTTLNAYANSTNNTLTTISFPVIRKSTVFQEINI